MGHLFYILVVYLFDTKVERNEFREMIFKIFFPFFLSDHIEKKKTKKKNVYSLREHRFGIEEPISIS